MRRIVIVPSEMGFLRLRKTINEQITAIALAAIAVAAFVLCVWMLWQITAMAMQSWA